MDNARGDTGLKLVPLRRVPEILYQLLVSKTFQREFVICPQLFCTVITKPNVVEWGKNARARACFPEVMV